MNMRHILYLFLAAALMTLLGCANGGKIGTPVGPATRVIVKLQTSGTLPAGKKIGGIEAKVTYPSNKGLSISSDNAAASGEGAGSLFAANTTNPGRVVIGLVSALGIQTGEFATLTYSITSGNPQVSAADFVIATGANVIDPNSAALPGITVTIKNITLQ